jgi:DUF1680 family protein
MIPVKAHTSKMNIAVFLTVAMALSASAAASKCAATPEQAVRLFPLKDVRLLESPFSEAVEANRRYLLAHDPDRLLAPFRREAGLEPKAQPYGNWESSGLDGHTAGHYLSAISLMMASGADSNGEFHRRLDYMIDELADVQKANGSGYIGGIPKSGEYRTSVAAGRVELMGSRWAPWYNLHKVFAGLRDAYLSGGNEKARDLLVRCGDWCEKVTSGLTDAQMQRMIGHREGPETCNTYNMLRLTKELFAAEPKAAYADFYERALYNHILASINVKRPGYVYFTPIRPAHYRVHSQPEQAFWCCVGTGMENPGRYGEFIYARANDGVYVNLFIPSELSAPDDGMVLRQKTTFPDEARTRLALTLKKPGIRHSDQRQGDRHAAADRRRPKPLR